MFSEAQNQLRDVIRRFLRDHSGSADVRRSMNSEHGFDLTLWQSACDDLGLAGIAVSDHLGGSGFGYPELCIAMEEMGRQLFCAPFFLQLCWPARRYWHLPARARNRI